MRVTSLLTGVSGGLKPMWLADRAAERARCRYRRNEVAGGELVTDPCGRYPMEPPANSQRILRPTSGGVPTRGSGDAGPPGGCQPAVPGLGLLAGDPVLTDPYLPDGDWPGPRRLHQYYGLHDETWGGVTLDVSDDAVDAAPSTRPGPTSPAVPTCCWRSAAQQPTRCTSTRAAGRIPPDRPAAQPRFITRAGHCATRRAQASSSQVTAAAPPSPPS